MGNYYMMRVLESTNQAISMSAQTMEQQKILHIQIYCEIKHIYKEHICLYVNKVYYVSENMIFNVKSLLKYIFCGDGI